MEELVSCGAQLFKLAETFKDGHECLLLSVSGFVASEHLSLFY